MSCAACDEARWHSPPLGSRCRERARTLVLEDPAEWHLRCWTELHVVVDVVVAARRFEHSERSRQGAGRLTVDVGGVGYVFKWRHVVLLMCAAV
jgi:hypothetical protein